MGGISVGVDVGGTFTDLAAIVDGELVTVKVPSVPGEQAVGISAALAAAGLDGDAIGVLAHGTTVATNALLERRGARTALVTTEGFRDVIEIGRQNRASLYDLTAHRPAPLVPRELRFVVRERMGPEGVVVPLDAGSLRSAVAALASADVEAVAVCLLFSFRHPAHEQAVGRALREALPGVRVSLSSELLPEFREYERCSTTVANAYLAPALSAYLEEIRPRPLVMQSSGGVTDAAAAAARPAACVLSGPAAGVVGAAFVARASGFDDVLTFDMGGTSTDVAAVLGGEAQVTAESVVAGVPIRFPMVDVHTIGAGGGSIAWLDDGGALRVGPRSAGARPGPACYGLGGGAPTVTDANLVLGHLADGAVLGGEVTLDRALAEQALAELPVDEISQKRSTPGLRDRDVTQRALAAAGGVVRVVDAEMARALRVVSVERGIDPRGLALVAFGGAGPLHACSLAEDLGMERVLVPEASGVLSALGLAAADLRRDYVGGSFEEMEAAAASDLPDAVTRRLVDARYRGQSHELTVAAEDWEANLAEAHERRFGFRPGAEPELVTRRLLATLARERPSLARTAQGRAGSTRRAFVDGGWLDVPVHGPGAAVEGPAIVELAGATCLVRPGWAGAPDAAGTLVLERTWTR
ncbi:MAG TPA: hydantoinase/oxoprolinase family protein [Gaiellaceae bacterium]|nr:hydantoinase/oxoprolinase family protein [Gaiellaceae bacterium]